MGPYTTIGQTRKAVDIAKGRRQMEAKQGGYKSQVLNYILNLL